MRRLLLWVQRLFPQGTSRRLYRTCLRELGGCGICTFICHWLKATGEGVSKPEGASNFYHSICFYSIDTLSEELTASTIWLLWLFLIMW